MQILYSLLFFIFSLFYLPLFFLKGKHRAGMSERFGNLPATLKTRIKAKKVLWVHAVSVGEVALALRLVKYWRGLFPGTHFHLTTTTSTGYEVASNSLHPEDTLSYFPVDFKGSVKRFVEGLNPSTVVILETEIWPNLIHELFALKIPVFIMNGRISDRAFPKYRAVRFFLKATLTKLSGVGVQDEEMGRRFAAIGTPADKIKVTGNIKYDWQPSGVESQEVTAIKSMLFSSPAFWFLAASTHEGEEEAVLDIAIQITRTHPNFRVLIAPRHLNRLPALEAMAHAKGVTLKKVFEQAKNDYDSTEAINVWLLDRMGVLVYFYSVAEVVFVGGSLVPAGGHNMVEPAYFGKAICFGPRTENFSDMASEFCSQGAAIRVKDPADLKRQILEWMNHPQERVILGKKARKVVDEKSGALEKNTNAFLMAIADRVKQ